MPRRAAGAGKDRSAVAVRAGIDQFDGKTLDEMKEIAKMMQIDTSAIDAFDDVQLWKEFVTAAINAKGA